MTGGANLSDDKWQDASKKLYSYLIKPVLSNLNNVNKIIIVPHLELHYLPFELLFNGNQYLLESGKILYYLPSVSTYKFCLAKINKDNNKLLAFGNPYLGENGPPPLINAEIEAKKIAKEIPDNKILIGKEATESEFKNLAARYNIIHLATHAALNADNPLFSRVYLAEDGSNDGQLEVHEVFEMNLKSKIVILSACQTALKAGYKSQFPAGDDLVGLCRAFIYAGAPGVIASLWNVADQPTEELMVAFYRYYRDYPMGKALNMARLDILRKYQHPIYWAPFIFIGTD
jgi:CHAT domain-containing protein